MGTFDDINLERADVWAPPPSRSGARRAALIGAVALALLAAGLAWWVRTRPAPTAAIERMASEVPATARPVPVAPEPIKTDVPPLDALDPALRGLIGELTASPLLSTWLTTGDLARQIAALVDGVAAGSLPLRLLAPLRPTGGFSVVERGGRATIAPASYARYDAMAAAIAALDPAAVARVYRALAPRLDQAHAELGEGARTFPTALREGLRRLAETPVPDGPIAVITRGGVYAFADARLEALSPAQKLLLRSGPDNARRVQAQLAAIAAAIGRGN